MENGCNLIDKKQTRFNGGTYLQMARQAMMEMEVIKK